MKLRLYFAPVLCVLIFQSCRDQPAMYYHGGSEFHVAVDSIWVSKVFVRGDTIKARIWAVIGETSCYEFSRYDAKRDSFEVRLRVYGKHYYLLRDCIRETVALRGAVYRVWPSYPGKFSFVVEQPDGSVLIATTTVLE